VFSFCSRSQLAAETAALQARRHDANTPIMAEVYAMFYEGKDARQALQGLTTRESKAGD